MIKAICFKADEPYFPQVFVAQNKEDINLHQLVGSSAIASERISDHFVLSFDAEAQSANAQPNQLFLRLVPHALQKFAKCGNMVLVCKSISASDAAMEKVIDGFLYNKRVHDEENEKKLNWFQERFYLRLYGENPFISLGGADEAKALAYVQRFGRNQKASIEVLPGPSGEKAIFFNEE